MWKRVLSFVLAFVMLCTMTPIFPLSVDAVTEDYKNWAQSDSRWGSIRMGSSSKTVASIGCLVTAVTKLIIQCGLRDADSFNVATLVNWLNSKGGIDSTGGLYFNYPASMISGFSNKGYIINEGSYSSSDNNDYLLDYVRKGYHMSINVDGGGHWVAVDEAMSLYTGQIYIMDSWANGHNTGITLASRYPTFVKVHAYTGGNTPSVSIAPEKPVLNTAFSGRQVTFSWAATANTTHYNLWLAKKNDAGEWESVGQIFYAENGVSRTLEDGEYRAQLLSYNSNGWEADGSDWLHTWADDVFFTVDESKQVTYYQSDGSLWLSETAENGSSHTLASNYPAAGGSYFSGWAYTQNADLFDVRPGYALEISGDIDLYPVYVSHEEAISGEAVLIYNIADFTADGYTIEATEETVYRDVTSGYWTDWSDYSTTAVSPSDTVEVKTTPLYKYYYYLCPSCGGREPFWGTSDCGATIPDSAWNVAWFATPYSQCNYQTYSYTTAKYYTTSLGDGQIWNFSAGNLNDTAVGTLDAGGSEEVITTGYSSRTYVTQSGTTSETVTAYRITPDGPDFPISGTCGDDLTWVLDENGTLTISGTGAMYDYSSQSPAPWSEYSDYISAIVIENGITELGAYAFYNCHRLSTVSLPSGISSIPEYAFYLCGSLRGITIPDGVTSIGNDAFRFCSSLGFANIPQSVTSIGYAAFSDCVNLYSITIPDGVTTVSDFAFYNCRNLTNVEIPESVTKIRRDAFSWCTTLPSIVIPEGVTDIEQSAFAYCSGLSSVALPSTLASVGTSAFAECSGLLDVSYNGTESDQALITIDSSNECLTAATWHYTSGTCGDNLTWVLDENGTLTISGTGAMKDYDAVDISPFYYICDRIIEIKIGDGVTRIGNFAFMGCNNLTKVTIPESVTSIGHQAFRRCTNLTSVTIPKSVTSIDTMVFYGCSGLISITIPDSVTSIGDYAFYQCTNMTDVYYLGTEQKKDEISIGGNNEPLNSATWHCNPTSVDESQLPKLNVNLTLNETVDMNFFVPEAVASQVSSYVVKKNGELLSSSEYTVTPQSDGRIRIRYSMNADRMCDVIYVQAFDANGNAITQHREMSIRDYGQIILNGDYNLLDKYQIIAMLDYGTLAQVANQTLPASGSANSIVSSENRSSMETYAWPTTTASEDSASGSLAESGLSVNLTLSETVDMNFIARENILDGNYTVIVKKNGTVLSADQYTVTMMEDGRYRVRYSMNANCMCDVISVQIVNRDKTENTYKARSMSIRQYAQIILDSSAYRDIDKYLMIAMLDYGSLAQINLARVNGQDISSMDLANRYVTAAQREFYNGYDWTK